MLGELQTALVAALRYLVPFLVIAVGIRLWWDWRRAEDRQR